MLSAIGMCLLAIVVAAVSLMVDDPSHPRRALRRQLAAAVIGMLGILATGMIRFGI